jgi:hypothetical protein
MKRALMLVLPLIFVLALALSSAASARAVVHVSGTDLGPDAGTTVCQPITQSGSLLRCTTPDFATSYSGDLTGTINSNFTWIINCTSSLIEGQGVETFTGSVASVGSGTLTWQTKFHATFDCSTRALSKLDGTGTITSGTGALTGLRGTLIFTGQTYSGILSQSSGA